MKDKFIVMAVGSLLGQALVLATVILVALLSGGCGEPGSSADSGLRVPAPVPLQTTVSTEEPAEMDLQTLTVPAGSLSRMRVTAWGIINITPGTKTLRLYFGSEMILFKTFPADQGFDWQLTLTVVPTGPGSQKITAILHDDGPGVRINAQAFSLEDDTDPIQIRLTSKSSAGVSGTIVVNGMEPETF